jgi:hypothetical protein
MLGLASSTDAAVDLSVTGEVSLRPRLVVSWRIAVGFGVALVVLACLVVVVAGGFARPRVAVSPLGSRLHEGLSGLPLAAQGAVSSAVGRDAAAFRVTGSDGRLRASNVAQGMRMRFGRSSGVLISSRSVTVGLGLRAMGYGSALSPFGAVAPRAHANRVVYSRPGVSEWYENGPLGLEQGFTIDRAPRAGQSGALTLAIGLTGNARPSLSPGGESVVFNAGGASLRYDGLLARDARGRALRSWLALERGALVVRVETRGARFPVEIDPLIQQGEAITGTGEVGDPLLGLSTAISAGGRTAVVGGPHDDSKVGAVWVFTRSGATWTQQGEKLTGTEEVGKGEFGQSVALSTNCNTVLIGGNEDNGAIGAAWIFTRSGGKWTQQGGKLTGAEESGDASFGNSVALSANGNTALIGGPNDDEEVGAVWLFKRSDGAWSQAGEKQTLGFGGKIGFGRTVALSGNGTTVVIGTPNAREDKGTAWVFTLSETGSWSRQAELAPTTSEEGKSEFGISASLSTEGNTVLVGGWRDNDTRFEYNGAAWVYSSES